MKENSMEMILLAVLICVAAATLVKLFFKSDRVVVNVYRLPGRWYWLKRILFYVLFKMRSTKRTENKHTNGTGQHGYGRGFSDEDMEKPQLLKDDKFAIDTCYFGATNKDGVKLVCRIARRRDRIAEVWLFLELPRFGCLQLPRHPDTDVYFTDGKTFRAAGLSFEIIEPMKKWKLTYSGKLRKGLCNEITDKPEEFLETSFSLTWNAFSQPFNTDTDMAVSLLGDSVARETWNKDFLERLKLNHQTHYDQWGELRGRINIEGQERQLTLQSVRDHSFGLRDWRCFHRYIIHYIYLDTGMSIQVGIFSQPNLMSHVKIGYVSYATGDIVSVTDIMLSIWEVGEDTKEPPKTWTFGFKADGQTFNVRATRDTTCVWYLQNDRGGKVFEAFTTFEVNSFKGRGISEYFYRNPEGPCIENIPLVYDLIEEPSSEVIKTNSHLLALPFTSLACQSPALVGGKGAQLAQLTSIESKVSAKVSPGFCLTLKCFDLHVKTNSDIKEAIQNICSTAINDHANLASACSHTVQVINSTDIDSEVQEVIVQFLKDYIDIHYERIHLAIRSSAAGEDGAEASSAGQMETILGVVGLSQILDAVKKCWSSAFTIQAVEYRRQHGQPINVLVGVVIQKMVPADAAGVLFTADPITQSISHLVINANFGLGESVVSGKVNPDTVYIERDPEYLYDSERLKIGQVCVGNKTVRIVETGQGGVVEECLGAQSNQLCIEDSLILRIAQLGVELEKYYGSPRDVEWAVANNVIFLLQCRPITIVDSETEDDLMHEFDSPSTCDYQWWTTCNIGEMMPGAVTPLTSSNFSKFINRCMQRLTMYMGVRQNVSGLPKDILVYCNHLFLSIVDISAAVMTTMFVKNESMNLSLLGQLLPDLHYDQIQQYYGRSQLGRLKKLFNFIRMIKVSMTSLSIMKEWEVKLNSFEIGADAKTSSELFHCIEQHLDDCEKVWLGSILVSSRSGNLTTALMSIIAGDPDKWTPDHYGDIALLLSNCTDVYSAEVPHAMESIAKEIAQKGQDFVDVFLKTEDKECIQVIERCPDLKKSVDNFLSRHGHRCLRESEYREKSWRAAPEKFISVLKIVLKTKTYETSEKKEVSISELLGKLKTKIPFHKKWIIKFVLPKAWKSVGEREWAKSLAVKMNDILKTAYSRLSTLLFQEGRLPDSDLMYFLMHQEISKLLYIPSARLIIKAQKRRNILKKQMEMKFEKISKSHPMQINISSGEHLESDVETLK
ncbi:phosphoenolpyruvate synthase, partial [Biomphalaria glabrata]